MRNVKSPFLHPKIERWRVPLSLQWHLLPRQLPFQNCLKDLWYDFLIPLEVPVNLHFQLFSTNAILLVVRWRLTWVKAKSRAHIVARRRRAMLGQSWPGAGPHELTMTWSRDFMSPSYLLHGPCRLARASRIPLLLFFLFFFFEFEFQIVWSRYTKFKRESETVVGFLRKSRSQYPWVFINKGFGWKR